MFEYASVSASAYDVNSLVGKLNEKASDGWEVVSIVPTGGDVTAFLKRSATSSNGEAAEVVEEETEIVAVTDIEPIVPIAEPAGWTSDPGTTAAEEVATEEVTTDEPAAAESDWSPAAAGAAAGAASEWAATSPGAEEPAANALEPEPIAATAAVAAAPAPAPAPVSVPTTPAGWYPDPSGRYEMRYWDGDKWTEHVSRQGQTFTDPPVA